MYTWPQEQGIWHTTMDCFSTGSGSLTLVNKEWRVLPTLKAIFTSQVVAVQDYPLCPVVEASHQTLFHMFWVVGAKVKVVVCVCRFPVHHYVQIATLHLIMQVSRNGRVPSCSSSTVNCMEGRTLLRWRRRSSTTPDSTCVINVIGSGSELFQLEPTYAAAAVYYST